MDISSFITGSVVGALVAAAIGFIVWQQRRLQPVKRVPESGSHIQPDPILLLLGQDTGVDLLTEMVRIQHQYQQTQLVSEKAIILIRDFLDIVERQIDLKPLEEFGSQVAFDPRKHKAFEYHEEGEQVWIIQPGWKRRDDILKWPVVQATPVVTTTEAFNPSTALLGKGTELDLLTAMARLVYHYHSEQQGTSVAGILIQKFLDDVAEQLGLQPLAKVGERVRFDPVIHQAYRQCEVGKPVWIVQPGWQLRGEVLKRAIVRMEPEVIHA